MKKSIVWPILGAACISLYTIQRAYTDINGKTAVTGAPGETTCSQSTCHGAGSGGLADNAGPGAVSISSSNMTNWQFTAGQTYHITVVNTDINAGVFGVGVSVLDNATNRSTGSLVITDATHTQIKTKSVSGSTRQYITHKDKAGATTTKPGTFSFDWTAPTGVGSVTFYFASVGANNDGTENGGDNVYTGQQVATLSSPTGLDDNLTSAGEISLFPNPAKSEVRLMVNGMAGTETQYTVYSMYGMKMMEHTRYKPGAQISLEGWKAGKYILQMDLNGKSVSKTFIVE